MSTLPPFDAGFGVYVHWPFCASKCPYCDFNSHVRFQRVDEPRFAAAFAREIAHQAEMTRGRTVGSIFLGGGTPSLMQPGTVAAVLDAIAANWTVAPDVEVTLEANPTSVEAGRLRGYRAAGVNRVSLGVQAMNDVDLRALGRLHSVEEAMHAVETANSVFGRTSFDLIYARPGQTPAAWAAELDEAIRRAAEHLSLYQLTIEPGTVFERLRDAGKLVTPEPEVARALFDTTRDVCERHGLPAYEISNHARPGAECRHNLVYWRYGEYAGVGPGAHARLVTDSGRLALSTELSPEAWLERVETVGHGIVETERLSPEAEGDEFLLMGLRLTEGIDPERFARLSGRRIDQARLRELRAQGLVESLTDGRLRVSREGFPVLDAIVADLAA
ncbi:radical SAM family heme chaperone HemW [Alsobacter sp. SYSU M60028]|uniref:Heme chaperone HemW n=1 Tax=Alsobacter ponti TaxID=2962936 RepID=A0ABT1L982_9HYPH|nr:radical SAM family heme chaperone HemW [Alsobacter ponti]MCP8938042.1 radical SAM family heme chaperone HemW [Alsobacter ponti]